MLRKVRDDLSTSAVVWKNGIDLLVQEEVLEASQENGRVLRLCRCNARLRRGLDRLSVSASLRALLVSGAVLVHDGV